MSCLVETCFIKMTPLILGAHNFLVSSSFFSIFSVINVLRGGLHLFFQHHKQSGPFAKMISKPYLK
jgi:hypothetical protein